MARLLSLDVGMPKDVPWQGRTVHAGIFKHPVDDPRMVRGLNIDGGGQGDRGGHGGEIRAVLGYQRQSRAGSTASGEARFTWSANSRSALACWYRMTRP